MDAGLAVLIVDIDLDANVEGFSFNGTLGAKSLRYPWTVNTVNPVKLLGNFSCFICLYRSDKVPADICQVEQRLLFVERFLQVIFAEVALAFQIASTQGVRRLALAHRQELDFGRVTSCLSGGCMNLSVNLVEIVSYSRHILAQGPPCGSQESGRLTQNNRNESWI